MYIIRKRKLMDTDMDYFEVQKSFSDFVRSKMDSQLTKKCAIHYIKYMSILSR